MARACGSYPQCHRFESSRRYHHRRDVKASRRYPSRETLLRPVGQVVKTRPFHGCNMGSSPVRVTNGGLAQLVRAPASHAGGHWFESSSLHQILGNLVFPRIFSFSWRRTHSFYRFQSAIWGNHPPSPPTAAVLKNFPKLSKKAVLYFACVL